MGTETQTPPLDSTGSGSRAAARTVRAEGICANVSRTESSVGAERPDGTERVAANATAPAMMANTCCCYIEIKSLFSCLMKDESIFSHRSVRLRLRHLTSNTKRRYRTTAHVTAQYTDDIADTQCLVRPHRGGCSRLSVASHRQSACKRPARAQRPPKRPRMLTPPMGRRRAAFGLVAIRYALAALSSAIQSQWMV